MKIFEWLESTQMALWVGEALWAYPFFLSMHVLGLAIVVGIFIMLDMRLLGCFKEIRVSAFLSMMKLAWVGFIVNAISGAFLFSSQASYFVSSWPFLLKIAMIFVGAIMAAIIQSKLRDMRDSNDTVAVSGMTKVIAIISLTSWIGAIITGRLIAYIY